MLTIIVGPVKVTCTKALQITNVAPFNVRVMVYNEAELFFDGNVLGEDITKLGLSPGRYAIRAYFTAGNDYKEVSFEIGE